MHILLCPHFYRVFKKSSPNSKVGNECYLSAITAFIIAFVDDPHLHVLFLHLYVQLTVYLGKRDFVDHLDHVDPVGEC